MGVAVRRVAVAIVVFAIATAELGCRGEPAVDRPAPSSPSPTAARLPPRSARHAGLQPASTEVEAALYAKPVDFAGAERAAARLRDGAEAILRDVPASLGDEDRLRYEGMIAQLRDRAVALAAAAAANDGPRALDDYQQVTLSCVKCHIQFDPSKTGGGR